MPDELEAPGSIVPKALLVEGGLGVAALVLGWVVGHSPLGSFFDRSWENHLAAAGWGVAAAVPMLLALLLLDRICTGPIARLREMVDRWIVPLFEKVSVGQMALVSLTAGIGEEMLFRGLLQAGIAERIGSPYGVWIAVGVAGVIFGLAHSITPTYIVLATIIGVYLGWLFAVTDHLLAPMIAHGLYDFVALVYLVRRRKKPG